VSKDGDSVIHGDWLKIALPENEAYLRSMLQAQEYWDAKEDMIGPMKRMLEKITKKNKEKQPC